MMEDPVPVITRSHFEEALAAARKSVTNYDLDKFENFRKKFDPAYAAKSAGVNKVKINWPEDNSA
jgi:transitional endoplasmic reticulum ATPase